MTLDISDDHELFDGLVTVTLRRQGVPTITDAGAMTSATTDTAVQNVLRTRVTRREVGANPSILRVGDTLYSMAVAELGGVVPRIGDRITDDGATLRVIATEPATLRTRHRVFCREES